jgi:GntR family transcriptional regulator
MKTSSASLAEGIDLSRSRVAIYLQLATLFRNWIAAKKWPVGARIPNVDDLAAEFSVARGTIREALGLLEGEGLLSRFRAKGTFVRGLPTESVPHRLEIDWRSLISAHEGAKIQTLSSETLSELPETYREFGKMTKKYQMMRRLHLRDGAPYLLGRFYLDHDLYKQGPPEQFRKHPTLPILHRIATDRIGKARQRMTIGMADVEVAALLRVPLNSPVAYVSRIALDRGGSMIYIGEGIYRGDAVQLDIELR